MKKIGVSNRTSEEFFGSGCVKFLGFFLRCESPAQHPLWLQELIASEENASILL